MLIKLGKYVIHVSGGYLKMANLTIEVDRKNSSALLPPWSTGLICKSKIVNPITYGLQDLQYWQYYNVDLRCNGPLVYNFLTKKNFLRRCLGVEDLIAMDAIFFSLIKQKFHIRKIFAWRSAVRRMGENIFVPYREEDEDLIQWWKIRYSEEDDYSALMFH